MQATEASVSTLLTTVGSFEQAGDHRERRAVARLAAEALERLDERGLLAADVGAGAHVRRWMSKSKPSMPQDVLAEQAGARAGCWMTSLRCGRR